MNNKPGSAFRAYRYSPVVDEVTLDEKECMSALKAFIYDFHII
jgi:hypothetical protein